MSSYTLTEEALKDLDAIWLYTFENWSLEQADRYYNLIMDEIEYLPFHFESGRDFGHIRKGYRCSKVKSHLIFFRKLSTGRIEIIRILHEGMDVESRLKS